MEANTITKTDDVSILNASESNESLESSEPLTLKDSHAELIR